MQKMNCDFVGCGLKAKFALYQLLPDFTKRWLNVCDRHDRIIAEENAKLRALYPKAKWEGTDEQ